MADEALSGESKRTKIITPTLSGTVPGGVILYLAVSFYQPPPKEKPATEVTDFSVNLVLNQSTSSPQQYSRSKDQDTAEDHEEPCAGAAGSG